MKRDPVVQNPFLILSLAVSIALGGLNTILLSQTDNKDDVPAEQLPVDKRDTGNSFVENLGKAPGKIITFPFYLIFKGVGAAAGAIEYKRAYLRVTDWLTNEEETRKVRPVFTPISGGGLLFMEIRPK